MLVGYLKKNEMVSKTGAVKKFGFHTIIFDFADACSPAVFILVFDM
jgi:hypothetical protein